MSTGSFWKNGVLNFIQRETNPTFKVGLWADCPLLAIRTDPTVGYEVFEDFTNNDALTMAGYTVTQAGAAGTAVMGSTAGGVMTVDAADSDAGDGATVQKLGPCFLPAADKDMWFEASFSSTYPGLNQLFVGLAETDTNLNAAGDLAAADSEYIGFACETGEAGVMSFFECKATAELSDSLGASGTLVSGTSIRVGFKVTGTTGIDAYLDGVKQTLTNVVYGGIPVTSVLTPTFICQSDGTSTPVLTLDWYRCVQLR